MESQIESFLEQKEIAVVGVSSKKKKFGYYIFEKLNNSGYTTFAVNPKAPVDPDIKFYSSINETNNASAVVFVTKPEVTNEIIRNGIPPEINHIWIQQGAGNEKTKSILTSLKKEFVFNKCIIMYLEPVKGIHKFHKNIDRIFSKIFY